MKEKKVSSKKVKPKSKKEESAKKDASAKKEAASKPKTKSTKGKKISQKKQAKAISDIAKKWKVLNDKMGDQEGLVYDVGSDYKAGDAIEHEIFGRGYAIAVKNNRVHMIFKDRQNILICNVKG